MLIAMVEGATCIDSIVADATVLDCVLLDTAPPLQLIKDAISAKTPIRRAIFMSILQESKRCD